jgi:uncharacterized protein (TIGR03435 family)
VVITNAPLRDIIGRAYGLDLTMDRFAMTGGPEEVLAARFDITAKPPDEAPPSDKVLMLRSLLADRFNLEIHRETRQMPIYALTVVRDGRLGPQLRRSAQDCVAFYKGREEDPGLAEPRNAEGQPLCRRNVTYSRAGAGTRLAYASQVDVLVLRIQPFFDLPVVDATDLAGSFEWALSWGGRTDADSPGLTIAQALEEQLGLKIERRVGPREILVIDSATMPTPN